MKIISHIKKGYVKIKNNSRFINKIIFRVTLYMGKKKKHKIYTEIWPEEEYEEYLKALYGMEFIAGYTEGGLPYGLPVEKDDKEAYRTDKLVTLMKSCRFKIWRNN